MSKDQQRIIDALQQQLLEKEVIVEDLIQQRAALYQRDDRVGGTFHMKSTDDIKKSDMLIGPHHSVYTRDSYVVTWSRAVRMKYRISPHEEVDGRFLCSLPKKVTAESWWHLCAQLGVTERIARLIYFHPENGQESAVAKAKPVQRGPIITCQGDYID